MLFGIVSSPFLLAATVRYHLTCAETENAKKALKDIYVDNLVTGTGDEEEAIKFYDEIKRCLADMSMNIREWSSNSEKFLNHVPKNDQVFQEVIKVLGIQWNRQNDTLNVPEKMMKCTKFTKKEILKVTASTFGPLEYFTPIVLRAKLLLQKLWREGKRCIR